MYLTMAPLQGVTTWVFRREFASHFGGFDAAMAPFISTVRESMIKDSLLRDILPQNNPEGLALTPQIMGTDPDAFLALARRIAGLGYREANWNLGCPSKTVVKKRRGAGMLPYPDAVDDFLTRVLAHMPVALSIKARLGLSSGSDLEKLMPVLNRFPIRQVIVHPRIGTQMYEGTVDLDAFERILRLSVNPVTYNGDIRSEHDLAALRHRFSGIDDWMIGRGAVTDPFLPAAIRTGSRPPDATAKLRRFHDALYAEYRSILYGPATLLGKMKELWSYWSRSFDEGRKILKRVHRSTTPATYDRAVKDFFDRDPVFSAGNERESG